MRRTAPRSIGIRRPRTWRLPSGPDGRRIRGARSRANAIPSTASRTNRFPSPCTAGIAWRYVQDMDMDMDMDMEHIVARSEAHDSALCAAPDRWTPFAPDPPNLTVAGEHVNRALKRDRDPAEWLPHVNRVRYARRRIEIKRNYGLGIGADGRSALERITPQWRQYAGNGEAQFQFDNRARGASPRRAPGGNRSPVAPPLPSNGHLSAST